MTRAELKRRCFIVVTAVFILVVSGLILPQLLEGDKLRLSFKPNAVVASTRNQYKFGSPLIAHAFSGTVLNKGRLVHVLPLDRETSGSEAQALLKQGRARLTLEEASISIGSPINGSASLITSGLTSVILTALKKLNFEQLTIQNSDIEAVLPGGFEEHFTNVNMVVEKSVESAISATGTAVWRGQNVRVDIEAGPLSKDKTRMPANFSMQSEYLSIRFNGFIARQDQYLLEGDISVKDQKPRKLAQAFNFTWPSFAATETLGLAGPMVWSHDTVSFDRATVQVGENEASGAFTIKTVAKRPLVSGTMAFDKLDLTPRIPVDQDNTALQHKWWLIAASHWSTPLTKFVDIDLRLSANEALIGTTMLRKAAATLSLNNNELSALLANLNYEDGSGSGQLNIDFNQIFPRAIIRGKFEGVPAGQLSNTIAGRTIIDGPVDLTIDIETSGTLLQSALESTSGQIQISQTQAVGSIGFDFAKLMSMAMDNAKKPLDDDANQIALDLIEGETDIDDFAALIKITNSVAQCSTFHVTFGDHIATCSGHLDLQSRLIDMHFLFHKKDADLKNGGVIAKSQSSTTPAASIVSGRMLSLRGPLLNPDLQISAVKGTPQALRQQLMAAAKSSPDPGK